MFGLTFAQLLALSAEATEMIEMSKEIAVVYQRHEAMIHRVTRVLGGAHADVPHEEAVKKVAAVVRDQMVPADRAILERRDSSGNN